MPIEIGWKSGWREWPSNGRFPRWRFVEAQIVAVAEGGTLHEHIPDAYGEALLHRLPPREPTAHEVRVAADSRLAGMLGQTSCATASWHHQAVKTLPASLRIVAHAPDGVVEAFEMSAHRWLFGVQWHPELTAHEDPAQQRLFDVLVHVSRENRYIICDLKAK